MGKAFVSKLAREGARDPEALAAWIGRKKHGKGAFAKLAAKGRKKRKETSDKPAEAPEVRTARARVAAAEERATDARQQADRANESASAAYGRFAGGQKILTGHYTERSALRDRARADSRTRRAIAATEAAERAESQARAAQAEAQGAEMRAARSRPWAKGDFQAGDTVTMDRAGRPGESYRVIRANAKSVTVSRGHAGMDNKSIPYDKILSRTRDGETSSDPGTGAEAPTPSAPTAAPRRRDPVAEAGERNRRAKQERAAERARMEREAEAGERAVAARIEQALPQIRALTRGARGGSITMGRRSEGVESMRLRRMSDADLARNLALVDAVGRAASDYGIRLDRADNSMLYDVGHALRSERARRRSR